MKESVEDAVGHKRARYRAEVQMKGDSRKREPITAPSQHRRCETSPPLAHSTLGSLFFVLLSPVSLCHVQESGPSKENSRPQAYFDLEAHRERDMIGDGDQHH